MVRHVEDLKYIVISLVREGKPDYKSIIETIRSELQEIQHGQRGRLWEIYRPTQDGFMNLKKLFERIVSLYYENIKSDVRYEISP